MHLGPCVLWASSYGAGMELHPHYQFKDTKVVLSIQGSSFHYCEPREDFAHLSDYTHVEMALFSNENGDWKQPSNLGIEGFDDLWEGGDGEIAGYVPYDRAMALLEAMKLKFGGLVPNPDSL